MTTSRRSIPMQEAAADKVARALPSATIVLARQGDDSPEVLMVRRRAGDAFGDSYTFPGGVLDDDESEAAVFCSGLAAEDADARLGVANGALAFYSAAVRELFEETGILLTTPAPVAALEPLRAELAAGGVSWPSLLCRNELEIRCDAIHYFAHWETPLTLAKRWSARFFLAELPDGQDASHDDNEVVDSCWVAPGNVIGEAEAGHMKVPFPTLINLRDLAAYDSVEAMLEWGRARAAEHVPMIRPVILKDGGRGVRFVIPGDPDYPESGG